MVKKYTANISNWLKTKLNSVATNIKMNGTQSAGSSELIARADHVHPVDTSRAASSHTHGNLQNNGQVGSTAQASKNVVTDANGKITTENKPTIPTGSSTATDIKMDGTQSAGSSSNFAKADHVHPTDTSRAASSHSHGSLANGGTLNSDITSVNKVAVTDSSNNLKTIAKVPFANLNITKANITGLGIPGSDTNTTYSAGTGLSLSSNSFSVKYGSAAGTACQGNDSRITNAVNRATRIGFSSNSSAPQDALNLSVIKGSAMYIFVRDAQGNVPSGLTSCIIVFNGVPYYKTISNGVASITLNTVGTFVGHASFSDGDGYQVCSGIYRVTVSN